MLHIHDVHRGLSPALFGALLAAGIIAVLVVRAGGVPPASEVDWLDLDGSLLLADDPFEGLELDADCRWQLPSEPGLGVRRKG